MALEYLAQQAHEQHLDQVFSRKEQMMVRALCRLKMSDRVLYIGAHPDDENNKLLTFLAQHQLVDTAYLSVTRGEGGQNFIGTEKGLDLGVLRVQESLAARAIEGTKQFFTRAKDFGFAKSVDETLARWDENGVLADMVWTIRYFRPTVIVTRFSPDVPDAHGHHQASAILAAKAFDLAADPSAYIEQLSELGPWQARQLLWNVYQDSGVKDIGGEVRPLPAYFSLDIPVRHGYLDFHYGEIAAESRNRHRSQAMGSLVRHQPSTEYFELLKGTPISSEKQHAIFKQYTAQDSYSLVFNRLVDDLIAKCESDTAELVLELGTILFWMRIVPDGHVIHEKRAEVERLLLDFAGVSLEVQASEALWVPGNEVNMVLHVHIPTESNLQLTAVKVPFIRNGEQIESTLPPSKTIHLNGQLLDTILPSFPTWLSAEGDAHNYAPASPADVVLTQFGTELSVDLELQFAGLPIAVKLPVKYAGSPVTVAPPVTATFDSDIVVLSNATRRLIALELQSNVSESLSIKVKLTLPDGLDVFPKEIELNIAGNATEKLSFELSSPAQQEYIQEIGFEIETATGRYPFTSRSIVYPHVNQVTYFPKGILRVLNLPVNITAQKVAYISGMNDELAGSLRQLVGHLEIIPFESIGGIDLSGFDAVVLGIRIYNSHPLIAGFHQLFRDYVEQGGVLIGQYNTPYDLHLTEVGAYPLAVSPERITDTESQISFLNPSHRILNYPNVIGQHDFQNWVQDRALFLPQKWASDFEPILRGQNGDNRTEDGLLLLHKKGKGYYIYNSLSLFRQLPAGVAGAYRLFANMLSLASR
ncbi:MULTISPECIES: PIG-L family deacetylase [unclassified Sphingobacterium]|uniref:PIG-L family deacetylase n=1 Tax=unclassified Sphingobacterium TaxID=2609468 RepID=UPI002952D71E|nr:PIG-L family deacetylase [Sphingobacterium sp. UGAL515B_05]WON92668.1 PIG-L family deacetylase [Sphingobacterium sp. UGAL515B_05]